MLERLREFVRGTKSNYQVLALTGCGGGEKEKEEV
jgi:hypothetical protein